MKLTVNKRLRLEKDIIVRVPRMLRGEGKIFVSAGREVSPGDIIGTATQFTGFRIVNLSSLLSVSPSEVIKYMKREVGQRIYKGELLAFKKGQFFSADKVITAPTDGVVDFVNSLSGEVRISLLPKTINLAAGVYGVVEKVDPKSNLCLIRAQVTRIYGMFGIGKTREGTLIILTKRDGVITKDMISPQYDECILSGGSLFSKEVLHSAISAGINGIMVGGINADDYQAIMGGSLTLQHKLDEDIGLSLVVCEGFGVIAVGDDIGNILKEYNERFVLVNGNNASVSLPSFSSSSMIKVRSTQLPSVGENLTPDVQQEEAQLTEGVRVRIIGPSFTGEQGKIIAIDKSESLMPSQIRSTMVIVETNRRKIQTSFKNIEIIQ